MESELTELLALVRKAVRAECDYNSTGCNSDAREARAADAEADDAEEAFRRAWGLSGDEIEAGP